MSDELNTILEQRGKTYGPFYLNAEVSQQLKLAMRHSVKWNETAMYQREALEMIAAKISRLLTGDPHHEDSWRDIAGYAIRVADYLKGTE